MLLNFTDSDVRDGIALAVSQDDAAAIAAHVQNGASPDAVDSQNITLLHHAIMNGLGASTRALLKAGASAGKMGGPSGYTAVHFAVYADKPDMIDIVIECEKGCLALRDNNRQTPLHLATYMGRVQAAQRLLVLGADTDQTNGSGHSAFDIVKARCLDIAESSGDTTPFVTIDNLLHNPPLRKTVVLISPQTAQITSDTGLVLPANDSPAAQMSAFERNRRALEKLRTFKAPGF